MQSSSASDKKDKSKVWMHSLQLTDKVKAAETYMPFIKNGGIFVETEQKFELGDSLFVLLTVGDDGIKCPVNGKVVWINSDSTRLDRPIGVGIQFPSDASGVAAKEEIERMIGKMQTSIRKTATL
ncbi:MAG: PilZ domain-containing protein [Limnobacter sp.]|nr:PilZ domain-containing protein [Limnobacter sp.]